MYSISLNIAESSIRLKRERLKKSMQSEKAKLKKLYRQLKIDEEKAKKVKAQQLNQSMF